MFKISVINKSSTLVTNQATFDTEQECLDWFNSLAPKGVFGKPEQPELKELQDVLITPAVLDPETGEVIEPAVYEQQEVVVRPYVPAEYEIVITDITAEIEAQQAIQAQIQLGELIKHRAQRAIAKITGYNTASGYTIAQVDQLEEEFDHIMKALERNRVDKAQALIASTEPTELISQELIDDLLAILRGEL